MNDKEKQELFDELLEQGMSGADALDYIMSQTMEDDDVETLSNLKAQLKYHGYAENEVSELINYKVKNKDDIRAVRKVIKIGKLLPVAELPQWKFMDEQARKDKLWDLGFDTKNYKYTIDVGCFRYGTRSKVICGEYIYGNERTDPYYLNLVVEGRNIASEEARFHKDMDTLHALRNTKEF